MRRFVTFVVLLLFAVPFGVSLSGCSKSAAPTYCNGQNSGVQAGQLAFLDLEPRNTGISLNQGQISGVSTPTGTDCRGMSTSTGGVTFGTTDNTLADVEPLHGRLCAGTWNRQTGGGIPDYTVCTPATRSGTAFVSASAGGVSSNQIPVYVHPTVTSIVLGGPSTNCATDPASNCYNVAAVNGACMATPVAVTAYDGNKCLSQGQFRQLVARTYAGTAGNLTNISCQVGPLSFSALDSSVVTIDPFGKATAAAPGSTIINANASQASSTAGFFSTCPPASIVLTGAGQTTGPNVPISINQNTTQNLVATVIDTAGQPITNLQLEYVSTTPVTIPANGSQVTPVFPGAGTITAICQPPRCNPSPDNEIGLFNNGTQVTSNGLQINATGTANSTVLFIGSTNSQYIQPYDFTVPTQSAPVRLPYVPNSMVLSQDLSSIYLGSSTELMVLTVAGSVVSLSRQDTSVSGTVLAVSPDSSTVVITDPTRKLIYLYGSGGGVQSEYGGNGLRAQWTPDSQIVYITTDDGRLLVHSTQTGWNQVSLSSVANDLAVTVPSVGVYLTGDAAAGATVTGRTDCPITTVQNPGQGFNQTTTNLFYPQADTTTAVADRLAATNDGLHLLAASATGFYDVTTNLKSGVCPVTFLSTTGNKLTYTAAAPTTITGVLPTSDSAFALVTYLGTGGTVPQYAPGTKALTAVALQTTPKGAPVAPVAGVVSSDNQTVYVGTSGDNLVHRLARGAAGFADSLTPVAPALPGFTGGVATPDLLVQKPRRGTN